MEEQHKPTRVITISDLSEAEQELEAELGLSGDGELLPEHSVKTESVSECKRCVLIAAKAVEIADQRHALPN